MKEGNNKRNDGQECVKLHKIHYYSSRYHLNINYI